MYSLTIDSIGEELELAEGQTILDAILRAGLYVPYQCGHGLCSTCKVKVLEGEIDHGAASPFALMDFERDDGIALACCASALSDLVIEADIDEDDDALSLPIEDYEAEVRDVVTLTPRIKGVRMSVPETFRFQAGQYINLQVPGCDRPRAFSVGNAPQETGIVELHVSLVEGGAATTYMHEKLQPGDKLRFVAPMGRFFVRESEDRPLIFIAGGSGLSSPKSMIQDLLAKEYSRPIFLFHGARHRSELYYVDLFEGLSMRYPQFTYVPVVSAPLPEEGWGGEAGFVHEAANRVFDGKFEDYSAYLCGPPQMIDASITVLMRGRCFEKHIFTEKFITEKDAGKGGKRSPLFKSL
ncbi:MAG: phenol hydroxylase [Hyphomonas sp. BRH_c22]|uniref:NADH:ubiquinone reductase (Na(+)-transporting) subunit F n=1 Tax=Hyphomonas sp. BRH_c22 TaxID=1629710 RepID=UPI0005F0E9AA|nr:2Fe-2S iron-sulfur cluster binding domain-containing protein [Hyphomonas sp. BRH_c22]KJS36310.1 MAG: phenol hydroxylase [Hyphomonas sp. BRH_c22]